MKVFKFTDSQYHYGMAAQTQQEAEIEFHDIVGDKFDSVEEVPESEWDKPFIEMHEDNDTEKEPFYLSIRDAIVGNDAQLIYTNDKSLID